MRLFKHWSQLPFWRKEKGGALMPAACLIGRYFTWFSPPVRPVCRTAWSQDRNKSMVGGITPWQWELNYMCFGANYNIILKFLVAYIQLIIKYSGSIRGAIHSWNLKTMTLRTLKEKTTSKFSNQRPIHKSFHSEGLYIKMPNNIIQRTQVNKAS